MSRARTFEYRWASGQYDRVPEMALELLGRQVRHRGLSGPAAITPWPVGCGPTVTA
jgi:hypothetical protein